MSQVMYKSDAIYVFCRAGIYHYTRRVPYDVRAAQSVTQGP
jgi:hypothetical protein